jgi:transcription elongation factor Elf1
MVRFVIPEEGTAINLKTAQVGCSGYTPRCVKELDPGRTNKFGDELFFFGGSSMNAGTDTAATELVTAMTDGGLDRQQHIAVNEESQQERINRVLRITGIGTFNGPQNRLTITAERHAYGVRVLGPVKEARKRNGDHLENREEWDDTLVTKGWVFMPFKVYDHRVLREGEIRMMAVVACTCKHCGAVVVRTTLKRDLIEAKHGTGSVRCKTCETPSGQTLAPAYDYLRTDTKWLDNMYMAWGDTETKRSINLLPRVWGLYPETYGPVRDLIWTPAAEDVTACQLAKAAMESLNGRRQPRRMVIRPLSLVRIEQEICAKEGRKSQLIELRLETPAFRSGWLLPSDMRRQASGDELRITLMPPRQQRGRPQSVEI